MSEASERKRLTYFPVTHYTGCYTCLPPVCPSFLTYKRSCRFGALFNEAPEYPVKI